MGAPTEAEGVPVVVMGVAAQTAADRLCNAPERVERLEDNIKILYHQTTARIATDVLHTWLKRGSQGFAGPAIYLCDNAAAARATTGKAGGVVLKVQVKLGNVKKISARESFTFTQLVQEGFDSVSFKSKREAGWPLFSLIKGNTYAIYNWDQADVVGLEAEPEAVIKLPSGFQFPSMFEAKGANLRFQDSGLAEP